MEWLLFSNLKKQAINLHKKHGWMKETRPERMYIVSFSSYVILGKKKKKILEVETPIIVMGLKETIFNQGS